MPTHKNKKMHLSTSIVVLISLAFILYLILPVIMPKKERPRHTTTNIKYQEKTTEPLFNKQAEVIFINAENNKKIIQIEVEVAQSEAARAYGLMHRQNLPENAGMLFLFDKPEPQSFWMKNTYIPLDIIFADENGKIISIWENTTPFSEELIHSQGNALFAVEVNAGFCKKHGIKKDDIITF